MFEAVMLSMAAALNTTTVSESQLFRGTRLWAKDRSAFTGAAIGCGYCLSHWIAFFFVLLYRPRLVNSNFMLVDYLVTAFVIAWLAIGQWAALMAILKHTGKELSAK